jgi:hypothetical protein
VCNKVDVGGLEVKEVEEGVLLVYARDFLIVGGLYSCMRERRLLAQL